MRVAVRSLLSKLAGAAFVAHLMVTGGCSWRPDSSGAEPFRVHLLEQAERAEWVQSPAVGPREGGSGVADSYERLRVLRVETGLAVIELTLAAAKGELLTALVAEDGREFSVREWRIPIPLAPDILAGPEEPQLAGLSLPRLVDSRAPIAAKAGVFYVGPNAAAEPCLRIVTPTAERLPESFALRYAVHSAHLAGNPSTNAAGVGARGWRAVGERTTEGWVIPAGAHVRIPLPEHAKGRFRARLSADTAQGARTIVMRFPDAPPVERAFLATGGSVELAVPLEAQARAGAVEIEVNGPIGSLVYFEEPRFEREAVEAPLPPNVCLVIVDTLRADRVRPELMPRLEELAGECLVFDDCSSTCSWTLPSVTTMLTSNHGGQHQAWLNDQPLAAGIDTLAEVFRRRGYRTAAFTGGVFVDQVYGLDRGFSTFDSSAGGVAPVTQRALEWLEQAGAGPWFVLVHTYEVHAPYDPPEEAMAAALARHPGVLGARQPEPQAFHDEHGAVQGDLDEIAALLADLYDSGVRYADGVLGDFFDVLRDRDLLDGAVLAVTSDHGEEFGEHGGWEHSTTLYGEQTHVPLVVVADSLIPAHTRVPTQVRVMDVAPTLLEMVGQMPPGWMHGESLLPLIEPDDARAPLEAGEGHRPAFSERAYAPLLSYRAPPWKLIHNRQTGESWLFDLEADPGEHNDVAERRPFVVSRLLRSLLGEEARATRTAREFPAPEMSFELSESTIEQLRALGYQDP